MSLPGRLLRFTILISLSIYIVTMVGLIVLTAATLLSRQAQASDYTGAEAALKEIALIKLEVPQMRAMAEAWASSVAYSYVPHNILDPVVFVSMTIYKKNLLIREVKSPMLAHVSHDIRLTSDTFTVTTVWRF